MAYANVEQDLVPRWRSLSPAESGKAATLLDDAAFWLRVWVPALPPPEWIDGDAAKAAKLLSVAMVKRAMQAEDTDMPGASSKMEVAGPFTEQVTFRNPEGNLYLYGRELADLLAVVTGAPRGAASYTSPGL